MARIVQPVGFYKQKELLANIIAKHTHDGVSSVLIPYLNQQQINLADDQTSGEQAALHESKRAELNRQTELYRKERDLLFIPVFKHLKAGAQFLKKFYGTNFMQLGEWGIPILATGRIKYGSNAGARFEIWEKFYEKHVSFAAGTSPLEPFLAHQHIDLAEDNANAQLALQNQRNFTQAAKQTENETEQRNQLWQPVRKNMRGIGNFLMHLFLTNTKGLGLWGLTVVESKKAHLIITTKVKPGDTKFARSVIIGSSFTNLGETELYLYKGTKISGNPVIVLPQKAFKIPKGYSVFSIVNPSTLTTGKFSTKRSI